MAESDQLFLKINLCGKSYELGKKRLKQIRGLNAPTFLESFDALSHEERLEKSDDFNPENNTYFFWRSPEIFESILNYYSAGGSNIHCPSHVCPDRFLEELEFWKIDLQSVAPCCRSKLDSDDFEKAAKLRDISRTFQVDETCLQVPLIANGNPSAVVENQLTECQEDQASDDEFSKLWLAKPRRAMWAVLEDPSSSLAAKVFGAFSVVFVLTSVISLILGSLDVCQKPDGEPHDILTYIESACVAWFTFEYLARFTVAANRWRYAKTPINIIDLVSVLPFYIELGLILAGVSTEKLQNLKGALLVMRILRVLRVARLFRLARYSGGMKSFGETLTASKNEIGMLLMFLSTTVILFSTTVYFMEKEAKETPFTSIPATFWWCVVTMTTVGYGDMIPVTIGGKLVASLTTISGVIVLAFPITMIVENFNKHYQRDCAAAAAGELQNRTLRVTSVSIV